MIDSSKPDTAGLFSRLLLTRAALWGHYAFLLSASLLKPKYPICIRVTSSSPSLRKVALDLGVPLFLDRGGVGFVRGGGFVDRVLGLNPAAVGVGGSRFERSLDVAGSFREIYVRRFCQEDLWIPPGVLVFPAGLQSHPFSEVFNTDAKQGYYRS